MSEILSQQIIPCLLKWFADCNLLLGCSENQWVISVISGIQFSFS